MSKKGICKLNLGQLRHQCNKKTNVITKTQYILCAWEPKVPSSSLVATYVQKHVCDDLVKVNVLEFKGKFLFIEDVKVRPKVTQIQ